MSNVAEPQDVRSSLQHAFEKKFNTIPDANSKIKCSTKYIEDPFNKMKSAEWHGTESIKLVERPAPAITDDCDAIVRITSTTICGSDLHFYFNKVPGSSMAMKSGDIVGHEAVGIITNIGSKVSNLKIGDRVIISAPIACGTCEYCLHEEYSLCDLTNPSLIQEKLYGHRLCGVFGYSHLLGGYAGLQSEYARVPFADINCLKVNNNNLKDEQILPLSDIMCTGYHGNELANVREGKTVVVWGCGPVGLMAQYIAIHERKAKTVIGIDNHPYRLQLSSKIGALTINFDEVDVLTEIKKLLPNGPECCIDCVGFRFPKTWSQWLSYKLNVSTDAIDIVRECIFSCKKGGNIGLIGDYFLECNQFPIGALMEKSITLKGGQLYCQKYWKYLLSLIDQNILDPSFIFSHEMKFDEIEKAYDIFGHTKDNCIKIILKTSFGLQYEQEKQK
jgi:threonine dehydrogenase-like Zn-dependent dehydrogenase